jgi:hypothetical protein
METAMSLSGRTATILAIAMAGMTAHAQQPITPVPLVPFADSRQWMLASDLTYHIGQSDKVIVVPKGFVTDFASIPELFWSTGLSPQGPYSKAAIVHDWLYWSQGCTKSQADNILVIAMKESGVSASTVTFIAVGLQLGGKRGWNQDTAERASGQPRIIPLQYQAFGAMALWDDYRKTLKDKGVVDTAFPVNPAYCATGDSTDIPQ